MFDFVKKDCIFLTIVGSHAYGLATAESDYDVRGVCIPPKEYFLGFVNRFDQQEGFQEGDEIQGKKVGKDTVIYNIKKAIELMVDCNPNMIDLLFTDSKWHLLRTKWWDKVLENRDLFISKKAKYTFSGYAIAQLKRIKTHRQWLLNPPKKKPERKDFGLPNNIALFNKEQVNAILSIPDETLNDNIKELVIKEKQYREANNYWNQYESWKKNRNPKRADLEAKYHYDVKHASHLVRLMKMGEEILATKKVNVDRTEIDAEEIRAIRNGEWTYDKLIEFTESMDKRLEELYETTDLKHSADREKLDKILINVLEEYYNKK